MTAIIVGELQSAVRHDLQLGVGGAAVDELEADIDLRADVVIERRVGVGGALLAAGPGDVGVLGRIDPHHLERRVVVGQRAGVSVRQREQRQEQRADHGALPRMRETMALRLGGVHGDPCHGARAATSTRACPRQ
ncbi:MAG: hypothetical protein J0M19_06075 [Sphingomonadales bacterium]|nr:hypothetical protein [Sphingomonadales bacterium]